MTRTNVFTQATLGILLGIVIGRYLVESGQGSLLEIMGMEIKIVLTAVAVGTLVLGIKSYDKWQPEAVGKRKLELAEDLLANVYQFRDIVRTARSPFGYMGEGKTRQRIDGVEEDSRVAERKDRYFATIERLYKNEEFLPNYFATSYRARALWGEEAEQLFEDSRQVINDIRYAVQDLMDAIDDSEIMSREERIRLRKVLYSTTRSDDLDKRLDDLVSGFENLLGPLFLNGFGSHP